MVTRVLDEAPSLGSLYVKAAMPSIPGATLLPLVSSTPRGDTLPDLRLELPAIAPDPSHIEAYREVCRFPMREVLPATYLHVLAFPLQLTVMTAPGFPFAPMGMVHVSNRIVQHRPIGVHETVDLAVWAEQLRPHRRGRTATLVSEASIAGEVVWHDETVLLNRGRGTPDAADVHQDLPSEPPRGPGRWSLSSGLGRRYAAVSGDRNPIHLYDVTAKAFGFRRHIAHGMWTKARCLADLSGRIPDAYAVEVAFKKPIELPSTVTFGAVQRDRHLDFGIQGMTGTPHLVGRLTAL
jgi:acyl dehydratase